MARHGYVHVSHKEHFNSKAQDGLPEFGPATQAPSSHDGIAPYVVDKRGEQFMLRFPKSPSTDGQGPGLEDWLPSEVPNALNSSASGRNSNQQPPRGWGCQRVFRDVLKTANAHQFPAVNMDQWVALRDFHTQYPTNSNLPQMPITISASENERKTSESFQMHGQPVAWASLWKVLAFRFSRPHLQSQNNDAHVSSEQGAQNYAHDSLAPHKHMRAKRARNSCRVADDTLAYHNGVTSLTNPRAAYDRAKKASMRHNTLSKLPSNINGVQKDQMYFVKTTAREGEFQVGLALALEDCNEAASEASFKWFTRAEWIRKRKHTWGDTPLFVVAADPHSAHVAYTSMERIVDVCPVPVLFTKQCCVKNEEKRRPKLRKECVQMLRQWCLENDCHIENPDKGMSSSHESCSEASRDSDGDSDSSADSKSDDSSSFDSSQSNEERLAPSSAICCSDSDAHGRGSCQSSRVQASTEQGATRVVHNRVMRQAKVVRYR